MSEGAHPQAALARAAEAWVITLTSGDATRADADALAAWRTESPEHDAAFRRAARVWKDLGEAAAPAAAPAPARSRFTAPAGPDRRWLLGGGLAALGAGVVALQHPPLDLWPSLAELRADHRTAPGEQRDLALAEGLTARLNTRTSLSRTGGDDHLRLLSGEAFFTAATGAPARVDAGAARVLMAASRVNVRLGAAAGEIACLGGEAEVTCRGERLTLAAGQKVRFDQAGLGPVRVADPRRAAAWRDGLLIFSGEPLGEVIGEINRYRPTPILLRDRSMAARPISGVFHLNALDAAVTHLGRILGARLTDLPGGFVLLG